MFYIIHCFYDGKLRLTIFHAPRGNWLFHNNYFLVIRYRLSWATLQLKKKKCFSLKYNDFSCLPST